MPPGRSVLSASKISSDRMMPTRSSGGEACRIAATTQTALRGEKVEDVRSRPIQLPQSKLEEERQEKFCDVAIARRQAVRYNIRTVSLEQTIQPTIATTRLKIGNQASCEKLVCGSPSMSLRDSSTGRGQCLANARLAAADT
jgi:hypothetical protein